MWNIINDDKNSYGESYRVERWCWHSSLHLLKLVNKSLLSVKKNIYKGRTVGNVGFSFLSNGRSLFYTTLPAGPQGSWAEVGLWCRWRMKDTEKWNIPDPTHLLRCVKPVFPFILETNYDSTIWIQIFVDSSDGNEQFNWNTFKQ